MRFFGRANSDPQPTPTSRQGIVFGDLEIHPDEATSHFMAVGATGSGKTCVNRLWLQSILPMIKHSDMRAMIADAKQDAYPMLASMIGEEFLSSFNPWDERGVAWDMAADIREYRVAIQVAFTLLPPQQESQPFFTDACRHLMIGVFRNFLVTGRAWTFGDLLRVLNDERALKQLLRQLPETRKLIRLYLSEPKLAASVMSTMGTKLVVYEPIAACWERAQRKVSLYDWVKSRSVVILGNSEISRAALDAINRCIFKIATDITLNLPESRTRRVVFGIDELANMGPLDGLVSLAKMGRSKGVVIFIAFQSVAGLRDPKMYGQYFTDEILGQFGNRFFGRLECPVTAEWASQIVGDQEVTMRTHGTSHSSQGTTHTQSYQDQIRRTILPSQFMDIAPCTRANGLAGLYMVRSVGTFFLTIPGVKLFDQLLTPLKTDIPEIVPRNPLHQMLADWSPERAKAFGFTLPPSTQTATTTDSEKDNFEDLFQ